MNCLSYPFCVVRVRVKASFCLFVFFSFGHCIICHSSIYGICLFLWYLQTFLGTLCHLVWDWIKLFLAPCVILFGIGSNFSWHLVSSCLGLDKARKLKITSDLSSFPVIIVLKFQDWSIRTNVTAQKPQTENNNNNNDRPIVFA